MSPFVATNTQFANSQLWTTKPLDAKSFPVKSRRDTPCEVSFRHCE